MKAKFKTMKKQQKKASPTKKVLPKKKTYSDISANLKDDFGGIPAFDLKKNLGCG